MWSRCLSDLILPLLKSVYFISVTSSSEESEALELGKEKGRSVRMLVHHSRNTERKQWDETLVLALNGITKIFKGYLPMLINLDTFYEAWKHVLNISERSLARGTKEVASSAICLFTAILADFNPEHKLSSEMLNSLMETINKNVVIISSPDCNMSSTIRFELIQAIKSIVKLSKIKLEQKDFERIVKWLSYFACYPNSMMEIIVHVEDCLPSVQREVLEIINEMTSIGDDSIWPVIINGLCSFLYPIGISFDDCLKGNSTKQVISLLFFNFKQLIF